MVKAVFFDWFNTLVNYNPSREALYIDAFRKYGIELPLKAVLRGVLSADKYCINENAKLPLSMRSPAEQLKVYSSYPKVILEEAGIKAEPDLPLKIIKDVRGQAEKTTFVLFDDVLPVLQTLSQKKIVLGILTNATRKALSVYRELGLEPYLSVVITSEEVGAEKPKSPIFQEALKRAGVNASEAIHVGDQYDIDIVGARQIGIKPVLIDRNDIFPEASDCVRISTLRDLVNYL